MCCDGTRRNCIVQYISKVVFQICEFLPAKFWLNSRVRQSSKREYPASCNDKVDFALCLSPPVQQAKSTSTVHLHWSWNGIRHFAVWLKDTLPVAINHHRKVSPSPSKYHLKLFLSPLWVGITRKPFRKAHLALTNARAEFMFVGKCIIYMIEIGSLPFDAALGFVIQLWCGKVAMCMQEAMPRPSKYQLGRVHSFICSSLPEFGWFSKCFVD